MLVVKPNSDKNKKDCCVRGNKMTVNYFRKTLWNLGYEFMGKR